MVKVVRPTSDWYVRAAGLHGIERPNGVLLAHALCADGRSGLGARVAHALCTCCLRLTPFHSSVTLRFSPLGMHARAYDRTDGCTLASMLSPTRALTNSNALGTSLPSTSPAVCASSSQGAKPSHTGWLKAATILPCIHFNPPKERALTCGDDLCTEGTTSRRVEHALQTSLQHTAAAASPGPAIGGALTPRPGTNRREEAAAFVRTAHTSDNGAGGL